MMKRSIIAAIAVVTMLLPAAAAEKKVTFAYITPTSSNWPAFVAQKKGFFEQEGLSVEWLQTGQSSKSAQQVMAGVANFGSSSMVDTLRAIDGGGDLVIFMNSVAQGISSLMAAKDITTVEGLKGKRVMVGGQKDITALWWYAMAKHFGMDGTKDVELLFSGASANRMAALVSGGVEASVLAPPASLMAKAQGFNDLGPIASYIGDFPMMVYHVNKTWAKENRDSVLAFVRAHNRAVLYMLDPANKVEVCQIMADASNTPLEDNLKTYDIAIAAKSYIPDGTISGVDSVLKTLVTDGDLNEPLKPASVFYDSSFVDAAKK
jgi:NitT/TauT family transport system substrate-binding protein